MNSEPINSSSSLEPLLVGLGQPGFRYGATYQVQGLSRAEAQLCVDIAGYYKGSIDDVTVTTENTSFTALSAEPYVQNPSLLALEQAKDHPQDALKTKDLSTYALQEWQDHSVSTDKASLRSYYSELQEQRIEEIIDGDLHEQFRTAVDDVEEVKETQNDRNNIICTAIDFEACDRANKAESLQVSPWETKRASRFTPTTYFDAIHARGLLSVAFNAMNVETHRMQADKEYLAGKGFTEVAAKAQRLKNTFHELRNRTEELYEYTGLAESMLAEDQQRRVSRRGRRIGDRIEKEATKQLKNHV